MDFRLIEFCLFRGVPFRIKWEYVTWSSHVFYVKLILFTKDFREILGILK